MLDVRDHVTPARSVLTDESPALRIKEGLWEEYPPPVHEGVTLLTGKVVVDIVSLPVNGQPVLVDMDIDAVNKKVCPVNMESSCRDANNACRQALSCGHANSPIIPVDRMRPVNTTVACKQARTSC